MTIRGMIFDFDGTLADTLPLCCAAFQDVARRQLGREYTIAEIVALFGPSEEGIFRRIAGDRWEACLKDYLSYYEREHECCPEPFPGVSEMLGVLSERDVRIAIVTGKGADSAAISLRKLELDRHFTRVESGSPAGSVKPEAIRRIVTDWAIDPGAVAYVGDTPNDITDARAAGVTPFAAGWALSADHDALRSREPAKLFTSVEELSEWIRHNVDG